MVKFCEQCGEKNKDVAKFCESCGSPIPELARTTAKKAKTPEAREAPEAPIGPRGAPRTKAMLIVVIAIIALVAALALSGALRTGASSPESVVYMYAAAVEKGDFNGARALSTGAAIEAFNSAVEYNYNTTKALYPDAAYKIEILEITQISKTDTEATFRVRDRETVSNAGPYSSVNEYALTYYFTKVGNEWKISNITV